MPWTIPRPGFFAQNLGHAYRADIRDHDRVLTSSGWRVNFRGGHPLRVRFEGRWREGTGTLVEDVDEVARFYADRIAAIGWQKAGRQLGIRINVDRAPTLEELREAVTRSHLSVLHLALD